MKTLRTSMLLPLVILSLAAVSAETTIAQEHRGHGAHAASPYAGMEGREIKSLSPEDLSELRRGGGWGLALPAELNGVPGPAHLLELKDDIPLDPGQTAAIEAIYTEMREEAIAAGEALIAAEQALETAFRDGMPDDAALKSLIAAAEAARSELRYVHLSRHLMTPPLLRPEQIARYSELRGYTANPCASIPEGHDPAMWRRHNGCN